MARFALVINCDNAAFHESSPFDEITEILGRLKTDLRQGRIGENKGKVRDHNGNTVGFWTYSEK